MKKWVAPLLVLALAVLFILCGKHITEKILNRPQDGRNRIFSCSMAETTPEGSFVLPANTAARTHQGPVDGMGGEIPT